MTAAGSYRVTVGSQHANLPIVPLGDDLAIAPRPRTQSSC
jgi:hypothetical protein